MNEQKERTGKTDKGVNALITALLHKVMGLSNDTINTVRQVISSKGEEAAMRRHVRAIPPQAFKRLNLVIDDLEISVNDVSDEGNSEEMNAVEEPTELNATGIENTAKKEVNEGKISFLKYLLDEQTVTSNTSIEDMESNELTRLAKMSPEQKKSAMEKKRRLEKHEAQSPRLRQLLLQKEKIEQLIAVERAKTKTGGTGGQT